MIRIETIWLALGASDLHGGIDRLAPHVVALSWGRRPTTPTCSPIAARTGSKLSWDTRCAENGLCLAVVAEHIALVAKRADGGRPAEACS